MKPFFISLISLALFCSFMDCNLDYKSYDSSSIHPKTKSNIESDYSDEMGYIQSFSQSYGYNQNYAIMIDYSIHSGKNRFFIVDLKKQKIVERALVCHGSCKGRNNKDYALEFSNEQESHCSTLGMSLIGERAYSKWGSHFKYWLDGLDSGNKNMRSRVVVLHSWEGVSDAETYPKPLAMSWGCPTISLNMLEKVDQLLKSEEKVLLYSFQ